MSQKNQKYAVILAAMLHDIGKFQWRGQPLKAGMSHEVYSEEFFNEFIASKKCIEPYKEEITQLIKHHGNRVFSEIVHADRLDAEANRKEEESKDSRRPLISILSKVQIDENKKIPGELYYYEPKKLELGNIFPKKVGSSNYNEKIDNEQLINKHNELFNQFAQEVKNLPGNEITAFVDSLLFLYEKYLTYVTSAAFKSVPDITLYDHSKTVTALANCYNETNNEEKPFLIVAADFSGIQNFIYNEQSPVENSTRGLSKRLRGKSFYLILLSDTFSDFILKEFNLTRANLLINGGGHFVILLPNTKQNVEKLNGLRNQIERWFYENFRGDINLLIKYLEADNSLYKEFPKWYDEIRDLLMRGKKQKSLNIIDDVINTNLDNPSFYELEHLLQTNDDYEKYRSYNNYEKNLFLLTKLFESIGSSLPKSNYIVEIFAIPNQLMDLEYKSESPLISFNRFNIHWLFFKDQGQVYNFFHQNRNAEFNFVRISKINDTDYIEHENYNFKTLLLSLSYPVSMGFRFIGKNSPLDKDGTVLEFEKIAAFNDEDGQEEENNLKYPLLSTLRMDVDNLGAIFSVGFERGDDFESLKTLSRVVNLSRDFNLFFLGYLNKLADKWRVYITYSGGDDLFVVGSWINIVNFAIEVKQDFEKFACYNPNITISGGIHLSKPNYPIGKAAKFAGENEEKAKSHSEDKNSISVFGREFSWNELIKHLDYGKKLDQLVHVEEEKEKVKPGTLHYILQQTSDMFDEDGSINMNYFRKISKIKYYLARKPRNLTYDKVKSAEEKEEEITKFKQLSKLINDVESKEYLQNFIIPASYVILKNRKSKQ